MLLCVPTVCAPCSCCVEENLPVLKAGNMLSYALLLHVCMEKTGMQKACSILPPSLLYHNHTCMNREAGGRRRRRRNGQSVSREEENLPGIYILL